MARLGTPRPIVPKLFCLSGLLILALAYFVVRHELSGQRLHLHLQREIRLPRSQPELERLQGGVLVLVDRHFPALSDQPVSERDLLGWFLTPSGPVPVRREHKTHGTRRWTRLIIPCATGHCVSLVDSEDEVTRYCVKRGGLEPLSDPALGEPESFLKAFEPDGARGVLSADHRLLAVLTTRGVFLWERTGAHWQQAAAVPEQAFVEHLWFAGKGEDTLLLYLTHDGTIRAHSPRTGTRLWSKRLRSFPFRFAVTQEGTVLAWTDGVSLVQTLRLTRSGGTVHWEAQLPQPCALSVSDSHVLVLSRSGRVVALDLASGQQQWWHDLKECHGQLAIPIALAGNVSWMICLAEETVRFFRLPQGGPAISAGAPLARPFPIPSLHAVVGPNDEPWFIVYYQRRLALAAEQGPVWLLSDAYVLPGPARADRFFFTSYSYCGLVSFRQALHEALLPNEQGIWTRLQGPPSPDGRYVFLQRSDARTERLELFDVHLKQSLGEVADLPADSPFGTYRLFATWLSPRLFLTWRADVEIEKGSEFGRPEPGTVHTRGVLALHRVEDRQTRLVRILGRWTPTLLGVVASTSTCQPIAAVDDRTAILATSGGLRILRRAGSTADDWHLVGRPVEVDAVVPLPHWSGMVGARWAPPRLAQRGEIYVWDHPLAKPRRYAFPRLEALVTSPDGQFLAAADFSDPPVLRIYRLCRSERCSP